MAALSAQGVVLAFAAGVSLFLSRALPAAGMLGLGLGAAEALQPGGLCGMAAARLQKAAAAAAGLASGLFTAVLGVKHVAAAAADSVAAKGFRFLIGGSVPIVGSAVGEALGSVVAGLSVLRAGIGILGVLAIALIHLFPLCELIRWRLALSLLEVFSAGFGNRRVAGFLKTLGGTFGFFAATLCFNAAVYVIALSLLVSVGR